MSDEGAKMLAGAIVEAANIVGWAIVLAAIIRAIFNK